MSVNSGISAHNLSLTPVRNTPQSGGRKNVCRKMECLDADIPSHFANSEADTAISIIIFFETASNDLAPKTAKSYNWAIDSLKASVARNNLSHSPFDISVIDLWIADMATAKYTLTTARYYLNNILSLYRKAVDAGIASDTGLTATLKSRLDSIAYEAEELPNTIDVAIIKNLAKSREANSTLKLLYDILLFSVYNRGMSLDDIISLRKDTLPSMPQTALAIARCWESNTRKFIFPLNQGRTTARKITRELESKLTAILSHRSGTTLIFNESTGRILWLSCALACGIDPMEIKSIVGEMPVNSALTLLPITEVTSDEIASITEKVADFIISNPKQWHAMRLRSHITPADIEERINTASNPSIKMPPTFYPVEKIAKRVGNKLTQETKAVIDNVLFFKSTRDDIKPLFRLIGDMAWCYRESNSTDSPYAVIPDKSMAAFQQMVCQFTPDIEMSLPRTHGDMRNRRVRVTGGPMAGYEGTISDVISEGDGSATTRIFRLDITGDFAIEWSVKIAEAFIQEI